MADLLICQVATHWVAINIKRIFDADVQIYVNVFTLGVFKDPAKKTTKYKTWPRSWHLLVTPNSDSDNDIMMMIALIRDDSDGDLDNRQWGGDAVKTVSRVHSLLEKGQDNATLLPEEGNKLPSSSPGGNAQLKIKRWQLGNPQRDPRWVCAKVN